MRHSLILLAFIPVFIMCSVKKQNITGEYTGSVLPGDSALLFSPGFINTGMYTRDMAMTPDGKEIYFNVAVGGFSFSHILMSKQIDGQWSKPEVPDFASNSEFKYFEPFISPDGKKFFYVTDEDAGSKPGKFKSDIWMMDREGDQWNKARKLPSIINSEFSEFFPSIAANGNLYFTREDADGNFIYQSKLENGEYQTPVRMPAEINAGRARYNATISANDSMMIVPAFGLPESFGRTDYYISFKNKVGQWSQLINMGNKVNSASGEEYSANWSPDGKYLFFMSSKVKKVDSPKMNFDKLMDLYLHPENGNANMYWIDAGFISTLKEKSIYTKNK